MFKQFVIYNIVGIVNTLVGFTIIFGLMLLDIDAIKSNAIGYGAGGILSYYLNSKYTFPAKQRVGEIVKFFTVLIFVYFLNLLLLTQLLLLFNPYLSQLICAIFYSLLSFILMRYIVFK